MRLREQPRPCKQFSRRRQAPRSKSLHSAKGFVRRLSCSVLDSDRLYLVDVDNRKLNKPIALKVPRQGAWYGLLNTWQELDGEDKRPDQCQGIVHAQVKLEHVSRSHLPRFG